MKSTGYIAVRVYADGKYQNAVDSTVYTNIYYAEQRCEELNKADTPGMIPEEWVVREVEIV